MKNLIDDLIIQTRIYNSEKGHFMADNETKLNPAEAKLLNIFPEPKKLTILLDAPYHDIGFITSREQFKEKFPHLMEHIKNNKL